MTIILFVLFCIWIGFAYSTISSDNEFSKDMKHKEILKEIEKLKN